MRMDFCLLCLVVLTGSIFAVEEEGLICFEDLNITATGGQLTAKVKEMINADEEIPIDCLDLLVKRGYFKSAYDLYDDYFLLKQSNVREIEKSIQTKKKELETLMNVVLSTNTQIQIIEPVFQWAQSRSHVFIQIKFAHRFDSPGCITLKDEKVDLFKNSIKMTAFGIEGYQPIKFELSLKLFKDIVAEDSYWKMDSVGRMFMNLTKTDATQGTLWKRLVESNQKIPIWWEMKTTYRQDMDDFQKIIDEEEDIKEKKEERERERKDQQKRKKKKDPLETPNSNEFEGIKERDDL